MDTDKKTRSQLPEVFINFGDAQVRQSFVSQLEGALKSDGLNVYVDSLELGYGNPLESVLKRIKESNIALVVLSRRYTESSWCLDELVEIKERVEQGKLVVLPIFYELNLSQVKALDGDFGINLWNHVKRTCDFDKLKKWKEALDFVSDKPGFVLTQDSFGPRFLLDIVHQVKRVASGLLLTRDDGLDLVKGDNFLGETSSDATSKLWNSVKINKVEPVHEEKKQENVSKSSTVGFYDNPSSKHTVFINSRGSKLQNSFVRYLVEALNSKGVSVYEERDELMGTELVSIFKGIRESKIALVIFSRRYTESKRCLDELVKIKELVDDGKLIALPIFYKVEPSQVRRLKGEFGDNFWNLWRINRDHNIIKWKEALNSVAFMSDIYLKKHSSEREFINFAKEVQQKILLLERENTSLSPSTEKRKTTELPTRKRESHETYLNLNKCHLFGMEQRMAQLEKKLEFDSNDTRIIGVVGMPGIGKTTLAMKLHEKWNRKFIRCIPLLGIRKKSEDHEPVWLRKTLLEVLLAGQSQVISDETTHASVKVVLLKTKIFAVLDDVSDKKQLEFLLGDLDWIKKGSKIVITTCDKSLLEGFAHDTYVVPKLNDSEAFQLLVIMPSMIKWVVPPRPS